MRESATRAAKELREFLYEQRGLLRDVAAYLVFVKPLGEQWVVVLGIKSGRTKRVLMASLDKDGKEKVGYSSWEHIGEAGNCIFDAMKERFPNRFWERGIPFVVEPL